MDDTVRTVTRKKKPKKRGRPEERLVITEAPETALPKLFRPKPKKAPAPK